MARSVFFSFHYQRDIWRVNQIRNAPNVIGVAAAGFKDSSLWEEAKRQGDAAIKRLIDRALVGTSVTVVCIGFQTAGRRFINYEIEKSLEVRNGLLGVHINHLLDKDGRQDPMGSVPSLLERHSVPIYRYDTAVKLGEWIEAAARAAGR